MAVQHEQVLRLELEREQVLEDSRSVGLTDEQRVALWMRATDLLHKIERYNTAVVGMRRADISQHTTQAR